MEGSRLSTGIGEFDRVLGGGAMKKSAILLGGEPGIGKSTLLIQAAASVSAAAGNPRAASESAKTAARRVLYVSGEESAAQIRARLDRIGLGAGGIDILCTSRLEDINRALDAMNPFFIIVDSIQTVSSAEAGPVPGTINQLKYCAHDLVSWVKERDAVLVMSAHVTKDGYIAGPKSLEHLVDCVITFERNDDHIRFLRAQKNRFGSVDELGIFSMGEKGLTEVEDPSALFITRREGKLPAGISYAPVFEGSRVFLVEIQALTVNAKASLSRVYSEKIDSARVSRVAAVLEKRMGLRFSDQDMYINVAGGVRLTESAIDSALAAALYSARTDIPLKEGIALVGELSLAGEVRPVLRIKQRVKTALGLGFTKILAPEDEDGVIQVRSIKELIAALGD
jgi:DNA repair protein RadA/Sms